MFGAKVIRSLESIVGAIQTANSTLSATPLLVSLKQGDNSFYIAPLSLGDIASEQCLRRREL